MGQEPIFKLMIFAFLLIFIIVLTLQELSPISIDVIGQVSISNTMSPFDNIDIISTRGHYDYQSTGQLNKGHNATDYTYSHDLANNTDDSRISNKFTCPQEKEIVIYIHGAWTDNQAANEQFNRTAISLINNNYTNPLIGFSWDSNTPIDKGGWETAKKIAERNGPKLAQFVLDFKDKCKDTEIRLIAHSLGARVVNSTLVSLNSNQQWNESSGLNITSVHLLGAAIDRNSIAANTTFGTAIEKIVGDFYNLRNSEDNMLEYVYTSVEKHDALGLLGISHSMPLPKNYFEREVSSEIPPIQDVDGNGKLDCFDFFVILPGDNHCGYIGARGLSPFETIPRNDGAVDIIVQDWTG